MKNTVYFNFAEIILLLPLKNSFTYKIPEHLINKLAPGFRVLIPFQKNKIITGIVKTLTNQTPLYDTKEIIDSLDEEEASLNENQITFFYWIAKYYMCHLGEVMKASIPSGLNLSSETKVQLNPNYSFKIDKLSQEESEFISFLGKKEELLFKNIENKRIIKSLLNKDICFLFNEIKEKYTPKYTKEISLHPKYFANPNQFDDKKHEVNENISILFSELEKQPKQLNVILEYFKHIPMNSNFQKNTFLEKTILFKEYISKSAINSLLKKGILIEKEEVISRFKNVQKLPYELKLSEAQIIALKKIYESFNIKKPVLLHGITGSGKTEIYISLIQNIIEKISGEVLFLMPEIALTTQMVERLKRIFGNEMNVYHSKYSENERVEVWSNVKEKKIRFVIGTRSAIFLPFNDLSLIIVDEEHDSSYKQYDPAPRYNARDAILMLARIHNANVILGSATPSIESYYNALKRKYTLIELNERYSKVKLPEIIIVDAKKNKKPIKIQAEINNLRYNSQNAEVDIIDKKQIQIDYNNNEFTDLTIEEIQKHLNKKKQVLIFQNRRGYAQYIFCEDCSYIPKCFQCDVSLTYHQKENNLQCHYCGHKSKPLKNCIICGSYKLKNSGFGTEKLEETINYFFPKAKIKRMDLDTTRKKFSYDQIIEELQEGKIDILIGTQMISKGFDFERVGLVCIIGIDKLLQFPDFRAKEKAFQIATQVSGRAGRRDEQGKVLIQTIDSKQGVLKYIQEADYKKLFVEEIQERKLFLYPPYKRLIKIIIKNKDYNLVNTCSWAILNKLKNLFKNENIKVLGPEQPIVSRIKSQFQKNIWVKLNLDSNLEANKLKLLNEVNNYLVEQKNITIMFDVDPH